MKRHPVSQSELHVKHVVEPVWKKVNRPESVGRESPIDEQAAPDHQKQKRKVDPMKPARANQVFEFQRLQCDLIFRVPVPISFGSRKNFVIEGIVSLPGKPAYVHRVLLAAAHISLSGQL